MTHLEKFKKVNPKLKFKYAKCPDGKNKITQVFTKGEWMCLHDFYIDNGHFKLGVGF